MERKTLQAAAANYSFLRGLYSLPAGLLLALAGLANMDWIPYGDAAVWAGMAVAALSCLLIHRHYTGTYGRIETSKATQVRMAVSTALGVALTVTGVNIDWRLDLPVNGTASALGLLMIVAYAVGIRLRRHHLVVYGGLIAAGLLPVWGATEPEAKINVGLLLMAAAAVVAGLLDHRVLRRELGPDDA